MKGRYGTVPYAGEVRHPRAPALQPAGRFTDRAPRATAEDIMEAVEDRALRSRKDIEALVGKGVRGRVLDRLVQEGRLRRVPSADGGRYGRP